MEYHAVMKIFMKGMYIHDIIFNEMQQSYVYTMIETIF